MVKANSLLYAVYVCLLVSILCGALLYYSSLYNMLNTFYNSREDMYIENQSVLNYALNAGGQENTVVNAENGIATSYEIKAHGLLDVLLIKSILKNDTIASPHFIGHYASGESALFVSNFSIPLSYSGNVKIIGNKMLPTPFIPEKFISNSLNNLASSGITTLSESILPELNPEFEKVFQEAVFPKILLKDLERSTDSIYFNSFLNPTIGVQVTSSSLQNITMKGNFILYAKDSIVVNQTSTLEDIILKAPIIRIKKGFKGNIQAFAYEKIAIEDNVMLSYPSVLAIYNKSDNKSKITIDENTTICGAVVLFGSPLFKIDANEIVFSERTKLIGDVYCTGKLMINGSIYGSVITNRIFSKTLSGTYENCIMNAEIDITKRPDYFISIPLFKNKNEPYGVFKKVL